MSQTTPSDTSAHQGYAGEVTPADAWAAVKADAAAVLVDVRTRPEWSFVGTVDMEGAKGKAIALEWQVFPTMQVDAGFAQSLDGALREAGRTTDTPVYFLCRSGGRSLAAARALTQAGYTACYNITGGFEGDVDGEGHRGRTNGWKAASLPWRQT